MHVRYLNELYCDSFTAKQAFEIFENLCNPDRVDRTTTHNLVKCIQQRTLGNLMRRLDPIAFECSYQNWRR